MLISNSTLLADYANTGVLVQQVGSEAADVLVQPYALRKDRQAA
ncbi:MAG: hypothetical protein ACO27R_12995 [Hylemonella sp.]